MNAANDPIWRDDAFHADEWVRHSPEAAVLAGDYPLLVPLKDFLAEPRRFLAHEGPLGIEVAAGDAVDMLAPHLPRLKLIAVSFPKFSDGRSYSAARLLRERLGFSGELRAVGDVLSDQIPLMRRCGITSFEVRHAPTRAALLAGHLAEMHRFYQPLGTAPKEVPAGTRPWLRQPAN
jgi:phosphoadenosine phosphosulfate reductase